MIVWFNCKITDQRLNPHLTQRYNLKNSDRFEVAKYSFASFAPLEPLVSKFIFNLEMADEHKGREAEMERWLTEIFPKEKLSMHWFRANTISQWKDIQTEIADIDDPLIFPAGNEDHIFLDSNIEIFTAALELIKQDPDPFAVFGTSHFPECIRSARVYNGQLSTCGNFLTFNIPSNDAIRVMKREFFDTYIDSMPDTEQMVFKTEHWNRIGLPNNKMYIPTKEQFRHFDGYNHVQIGPDVCPPLEIPSSFFDGMTIRYGFDQRDPNCVNVNPCAAELYTTDSEKGTDYKYVLSELPLFWKKYTKEIIENKDLVPDAANEAYDLHLLAMTRIYINWHHVGIVYDNTNWPPASWLNNHTKKYLFTDN